MMQTFGSDKVHWLTYFAVLLLVVFSLSLQAEAQSKFLSKGESGVGMGIEYRTSNTASGVVLDMSYSEKGLFDFGLSVERAKIKNDIVELILGPDLSATSISPHLTVHLIKQTQGEEYDIPMSLMIGASYGKFYWSGDLFDKLNLEMDGSELSIGGSIYGNISLSPRSSLIPTVSLSYSSIEIEVRDKVFKDAVSGDDNITSFDVSIPIGIELQSKDIFYISPGVSINDDQTLFSFSLGFVFRTSKQVSPAPTTQKSRAREAGEIKRHLSREQDAIPTVQDLAKIQKVLKIGTPKDTIREVLGDPIEVRKTGPWEYWYYSDDKKIEFKEDTVTRWEGF